ncbi:MAG: hypothetical protein AAF638_05030 [Pseudomonadota bacterium]
MSDETHKSSAASLEEADYETIKSAVIETERGRWFLDEFARRNRAADTERVLEALGSLESRIESRTVVPQPTGAVEAPASNGHESFGPDLGVLRQALLDMSSTIRRTRSEIGADEDMVGRVGNLKDASGELGLVVKATETATSEIITAAEQVQELAWTMREQGADPALCDALDARATGIYTACAFQDLTGQRISHVVETVRAVEARLATLIDLWASPSAGDVADAEPDALLDDVAPEEHSEETPEDPVAHDDADKTNAADDLLPLAPMFVAGTADAMSPEPLPVDGGDEAWGLAEAAPPALAEAEEQPEPEEQEPQEQEPDVPGDIELVSEMQTVSADDDMGPAVVAVEEHPSPSTENPVMVISEPQAESEAAKAPDEMVEPAELASADDAALEEPAATEEPVAEEPAAEGPIQALDDVAVGHPEDDVPDENTVVALDETETVEDLPSAAPDNEDADEPAPDDMSLTLVVEEELDPTPEPIPASASQDDQAPLLSDAAALPAVEDPEGAPEDAASPPVPVAELADEAFEVEAQAFADDLDADLVRQAESALDAAMRAHIEALGVVDMTPATEDSEKPRILMPNRVQLQTIDKWSPGRKVAYFS